MLNLPSGIKVYIATKALDMRKSLDGMSAIVTLELKKDIFSGQLFVFCNKRGDKIKIFYWDRNGYCCWYKRLERGVFRLPKANTSSLCMGGNELGLILGGIDLTHPQRLRAL